MLPITTIPSDKLLVVSTSMTLRNLELQRYRVLLFFLQFLAAPRTPRVNCDEMAGYRLRQFANRNCYRLSHVP